MVKEEKTVFIKKQQSNRNQTVKIEKSRKFSRETQKKMSIKIGLREQANAWNCY